MKKINWHFSYKTSIFSLKFISDTDLHNMIAGFRIEIRFVPRP